MRAPCIKFLITMEGIRNMLWEGEGSSGDAKSCRVWRREKQWKRLCSKSWRALMRKKRRKGSGVGSGGGNFIIIRVFLERSGFWMSREAPGMFSLFTYGVLDWLSLGISKMIKNCLFAYFPSGGAVTGRRKAVIRGCNLLLSAARMKAKQRRQG